MARTDNFSYWSIRAMDCAVVDGYATSQKSDIIVWRSCLCALFDFFGYLSHCIAKYNATNVPFVALEVKELLSLIHGRWKVFDISDRNKFNF